MAKIEEFDISPDPTLMEDIGATSFSVADAIVELVANSVDARVGGREARDRGRRLPEMPSA
jgi:hypothetical protein